MRDNQATARTVAIEVLIAGGITAVGLALGLEPIQSAGAAAAAVNAANPLIDTVTGIGVDWLSSLAERRYGTWQQRWLGRHGALNHDIAQAMGEALDKVLAPVETAWRLNPRYRQLRQTDPDEARRTVVALQSLRRDAARLFHEHSEALAAVLAHRAGAAQPLAMTAGALDDYLYGYDETFQAFVRAELATLSDQWLLEFRAYLKDPLRGTPAWRAYQHLLFESLVEAVDAIARQTGSLEEARRETIAWLQEREATAARQTAAERDPLGGQTLQRLDALLGRVDRVEATLGRVDSGVAYLVDRFRRPQTADDLLDPLRAQEMFGPGVRVVDLSRTRPATAEEVAQYYGGVRLTWNHIVAGGDVRRHQTAEALATLTAEQDGAFVLCLKGEPGAGKSTLAWRVAAEYAQAYDLPLLQLRDNESDEAWYRLDTGAAAFGSRVVVVADDIFRGGAANALRTLNRDAPLTIVATTRSNEIPLGLRWPPAYRFLPVGAPSGEEKADAAQRISGEQALGGAAQARLAAANSWLVMMLELSTGEELRQIVADAIHRLRQQDEVVYRAYEYLCLAGQYDINLPESLLANLDREGRFYRLTERPAAQGLIFAVAGASDDKRLQPAHSVIAAEAFKHYHRDPLVVWRELLATIDPALREQRVVAGLAVRILLATGQPEAASTLLTDEGSPISAIVATAGCAELTNLWAPLYRSLGDHRRGDELEARALQIELRTHIDWISRIVLVQRIGSPDQITAVIDGTATWLAANPLDYEVRRTFLGLVDRQGSPNQVATLIDDTAAWLAANPLDHEIRRNFLSLVERQGSPQQVSALIDETAAWLAANPDNVDLREVYLRLVERKGSLWQLTALIDNTAAWLAANSHNTNVRQSFLGLIERKGAAKQAETTIDETALWLAANPRAINVRQPYLGLVETRGSPEQIAAMLDETTAWLAVNRQDNYIRSGFLSIVERTGSPEQVAAVIDGTAVWLAANPRDTNVRQSYLDLVERRGSPEQIAAVIDQTAAWLVANPRNTNVRQSYLDVVERRGSPDQIAAVIDETAIWLAANPRNDNVLHFYLGLVDRRASPGQIDVAIEATEAWLANNAADAHVRARFIQLLINHGQVDKQQEAARDGLQWLEQHPRVKYNVLLIALARLTSILKDYASAERVNRRILATWKSYVPARLGLAWSLYYQGQTAAALSELEHALWWTTKYTTYPRHRTLHQLGLFNKLEGDFVTATSYFHQAVEAEPTAAYSYWELGLARRELGQIRPALWALRQAENRLPDDAPAEQRAELAREIAELVN